VSSVSFESWVRGLGDWQPAAMIVINTIARRRRRPTEMLSCEGDIVLVINEPRQRGKNVRNVRDEDIKFRIDEMKAPDQLLGRQREYTA